LTCKKKTSIFSVALAFWREYYLERSCMFTRALLISLICFVSSTSWAWQKAKLDAYFKSQVDALISAENRHSSPGTIFSYPGWYINGSMELPWEVIANYNSDNNYIPYFQYIKNLGYDIDKILSTWFLLFFFLNIIEVYFLFLILHDK